MFVDETLDQYTPDVQPGRCLEGVLPPFLPFWKRSVLSQRWYLALTAINQFEDKTTSLTG